MSAATIEQRLDAVEQRVEQLQRQVAGTKGILSIAGSMANSPDFDELMEHCKYIRRTGQLPPTDWKPGDPIPEPAE